MTQERLRELLRERVADETVPDLSARAWEAARGVRRRRRLGAAAGVVAATVAVSGGIAVLDATPSSRRQPDGPATSEVSPTPAAPEAPDATYRRLPVWFSPDPDEERDLPLLDQDVLPAEIDLGADAPPLADDPVDAATAAVAVFDETRLDRVVLLGDDGFRSVDLSGVGKVTKNNGYRLWPVSATMLAPDGRHLLLPQDGSVLVLSLADASWTRVDVELGSYGSYWLDDRTFFVPDFWESPDVHGGGAVYDVTGTLLDGAASDVLSPSYPAAEGGQRYGAWPASPDGLRVAQAYGMGTGVPVRDSGTDLSRPESIWVSDTGSGQGGTALSLTWPSGGDRWKECCPVAGWLDDATVVYESRKEGPELVAWTVGTHEFHRVARLVGLDLAHESYVASWALATRP